VAVLGNRISQHGLVAASRESAAFPRQEIGGALTRRPYKAATVLLLLLVCLPLSILHAQPSREYQIKAVFIFNFAQFTEWPANAFTGTNDPVVIGVLGSNPFDDFLESTIHSEAVHGRHLVVRHYKTVEEIQTCHILYIGQSEARRVQQIVRKLKGKPVLTVSDIPNAAAEGVAIGFVTERNRIKLHINLDGIKAASLTVSSKLLRLAQIVKDKES
jgi:hypothetical protein